MKKWIWIPISVVLLVLIILFLPIPRASYDDGGTKEYVAMTYKIVRWNRMISDGTYDKTRVYFGADKNKGIDELWELEGVEDETRNPNIFLATVIELNDSSVVVEPFSTEHVRQSADRISFDTSAIFSAEIQVGHVVRITYDGAIAESYPAQINALAWERVTELRHVKYSGTWIDKATAEKQANIFLADVVITEIYYDCFFARSLTSNFRVKINGKISSDWCVGDYVVCDYANIYYDATQNRAEADMLSIAPSNWSASSALCAKPVVYLYPEQKTDVSVTLALDGELTCTYPAYQDGWKVSAAPDGTLTDANGQQYNYLYWEGETAADYDLSKGFCIKGEDTAAFLENALAQLGLTRREANEFIVYWLPLMEENPYNVITFQTQAYTDSAKLNVCPAPNTTIRVFMAWQKADQYITLPPQQLAAPKRVGFTVVEWGGTEIK